MFISVELFLFISKMYEKLNIGILKLVTTNVFKTLPYAIYHKLQIITCRNKINFICSWNVTC